MFIDRIMATGFTIATLGVVVSTIALLILAAEVVRTPVPQVVRLVDLVSSPGSVILHDVGDSASLTVQGYYSDQSLADLAEKFITYESTDPNVVSASSDGVITANGPGGADIIIEFGTFSRTVNALVLDDIPRLPPIDPDKVGPIPGLDVDVEAVLNRVIVELLPGYDTNDAEGIASDLGGEVIFSYRTYPGHVIEFDDNKHALMDTLTQLGRDARVGTAYPDILLETADHPIDTLSFRGSGVDAYRHAGFEGAWRMVERIPQAALNPINIAMIDTGILHSEHVNDKDISSFISTTFDWSRIVNRNLFEAPEDTHGTAVASMLIALNSASELPNSNNGLSGIITSAGNVDYHLYDYPARSRSGVSAALEQIAEVHSDVINFSFKIPILRYLCDYVCEQSMFNPMNRMSLDTLLVAPAGNDSENVHLNLIPQQWTIVDEQKTGHPALPNLITVGALDEKGENRASFSNYGEAVILAAPGEKVRAMRLEGPGTSPYAAVEGTSASSSMVTGTAALLKAIGRNLTPEQVKDLLLETADKRMICTSNQRPCPMTDREDWYALRADKAVAKLLSDRIDVEIADRVIVPLDTQRVVGRRFQFGVDIANTGEMLWPLYAEAFLRVPNGTESEEPYTAENVVAPGSSHPFMWQFWPAANASGCWDMRVKVWMEDPDGDSNPLIDGLTQLDSSTPEPGLLRDSGWLEGVLEVRSGPNQPLSCPGADLAVPLPLTSDDEQSATQNQLSRDTDKANVLLLADTSGSMEGAKIVALKEAVNAFVSSMYKIRFHSKSGVDLNPDYVGLAGFDSSYDEVLPVGPIDPAGSDLDTWQNVVDALDADGGTALYDAIIQSVGILEDQSAPNRSNILIALTDGVDQDSGSYLSDAIDTLRGSSVTLFALALSEPGGTGDYDFDVLQEFANATSGAAYAADTTNLSGLYKLFSTIFEIGNVGRDSLSSGQFGASGPVPGDTCAGNSICELAHKYAPVLSMHPDEQFLPRGVEGFVSQARLMDGNGRTIIARGEIESPDELDNKAYDSDYYLDVPDNILDSPSHAPTVYATMRDNIAGREGWVYLQYYLFYYYDYLNPIQQSICRSLSAQPDVCFPHEADWELIQLEFESDSAETVVREHIQPTRVAFSQHGWSEDRQWRSGDITTEGGHPVAHVALGKHANYFDFTPQDRDDDSVSVSRDIIAVGGKKLLPPTLYVDTQQLACRDTHAGDPTPCNYTLSLITGSTPWVAYAGRWGGDNKIDGPDHDLRWNTPHKWDNAPPRQWP